MKRVLWLAAFCALALAGCDVLRGAFGMATDDRPVVSLVNGRISVDPPTLHFRNSRGATPIRWKLAAPPGARFADDGIVIEGEVTDGSREVRPNLPLNRQQREVVDCRIQAGGQEFMCLNRNTRPGVYKYTVNLIAPDGTRLPPLDPMLVNDL